MPAQGAVGEGEVPVGLDSAAGATQFSVTDLNGMQSDGAVAGDSDAPDLSIPINSNTIGQESDIDLDRPVDDKFRSLTKLTHSKINHFTTQN